MTTYVQALTIGYPGVVFSATGDGSIYTNITWISGTAMPTQAELDTWIAANPNAVALSQEITKYEFRKLFTFAERLAIDSAPTSTTISAANIATLNTMNKDMELSGSVVLSNPDTIAGVNFLASLGLIASTRVSQILSNTPPV